MIFTASWTAITEQAPARFDQALPLLFATISLPHLLGFEPLDTLVAYIQTLENLNTGNMAGTASGSSGSKPHTQPVAQPIRKTAGARRPAKCACRASTASQPSPSKSSGVPSSSLAESMPDAQQRRVAQRAAAFATSDPPSHQVDISPISSGSSKDSPSGQSPIEEETGSNDDQNLPTAAQSQHTTVEDVPDEDDLYKDDLVYETEPEPLSDNESTGSEDSSESDEDIEKLTEQLQDQISWEVGRELEEEELKILSMFAWKMKYTSVTEKAFSSLQDYFPKLGAESWKTTLAHVAALSGLELCSMTAVSRAVSALLGHMLTWKTVPTVQLPVMRLQRIKKTEKHALTSAICPLHHASKYSMRISKWLKT